MQRPRAMRFSVAGVSYRQQALKRQRRQSSAAVVRDPHNPHDVNAVAVYVRGDHIGYVPREESADVAEVIDAGEWAWEVTRLKIGWWDEGKLWTATCDLTARQLDPAATPPNAEHRPRRGRRLSFKTWLWIIFAILVVWLIQVVRKN